MKVSIIIPVYNVSRYIKRCLKSVADQTFANIECVLVDDCGTDDSMDIVNQYVSESTDTKQYITIHHDTNQGQGIARNTGIHAATGDYVYFLDSDDAITPDCIETLARLAEKYPDAAFIQGSTVEGSKEQPTYHDPCNVAEYVNDKDALDEVILTKNIKTVWNRLIKRSFIIENMLFFPDGIANCEDLYWVYFMTKKASAAAFTSKGTYYYYINANSSSTSNSKGYTEKRVWWHYLSVKAIHEDMEKQGKSVSRYQRQFLAGFICNYMMQLCKCRSLRQWLVFWRLAINICQQFMNNITWAKCQFIFAVFPPLCFLTGNSGWRWRLRQNVINKL